MPETKIQIASLADVITLTKNSFNEFFNLVEFTEEVIFFDDGFRELAYLASINLPGGSIYHAETEGIFETIKCKAPEIAAVTKKILMESLLVYRLERKQDQYGIMAFQGKSTTNFLAKTPALDHEKLVYEFEELSKIGLPHYNND